MRIAPLALILLFTAACGSKDETSSTDEASTGPATDATSPNDTSNVTTTDATTGTASGASNMTTTVTTDTQPTTDTAPTTDIAETTATDTNGETTQGDTSCSAIAPTEEDCLANELCQPVYGDPLDFEGCVEGTTFLGCIEKMPCDAVLILACKNGNGDEVYQLTDGCLPEGFKACDSDLPQCGDPGVVCEGLDEAACADAGCTSVLGAPHVKKNGMMCADVANPEFLGCLDADIPCAPEVISVCPEGQPMPVFDVASGCFPPGHEPCDATLPECP